jgi:anti-sigma factor ChrR (cupin superfamily)
MHSRIVLAFVVASVLAVAVAAQVASSGEGVQAPVSKPAADLTWIDLDPAGAPGVKVADLWGNHEKGAFGAFLKLPAGFTAPLHTHTHTMKLVIVSGTYLQSPEGKPEFRLGPGSYLMQPGGNYRHITRCDEASECLFFVESDGSFDLHPAPAKNAPLPGVEEEP